MYNENSYDCDKRVFKYFSIFYFISSSCFNCTESLLGSNMAQSYWREKIHVLRSPTTTPPLASIAPQPESTTLDSTYRRNSLAGTQYPGIPTEADAFPLSEQQPRSRRAFPWSAHNRSRSLESPLSSRATSTSPNFAATSPTTTAATTSPVLSPSFAFPIATATDPYRSPTRDRRSRTLSHPIRRPSTADVGDPAFAAVATVPEDISATEIPVSQARPELHPLLEEKTWMEEHKRVVPDLSHLEKEKLHVPNYAAPLSSIEVLEAPHDPGTHARMEAFAISNPLLPPPPEPSPRKSEDATPPQRIPVRARSFSETALPTFSNVPGLEAHAPKRPFFFFFGQPSRTKSGPKAPQVSTTPRRRSQSVGISSSEVEPIASIFDDRGPRMEDIDIAKVSGEISSTGLLDQTEPVAHMQ